MTHPIVTANRFNVTIHLHQGESAKALSANELIQRRQYEILREKIDKHLKELPPLQLSKQEYQNGSGWTQFLDGTRGAGKSTFLSSIKVALATDPEIKGSIGFIALIDPSRIERSEIILLVILQHLSKVVEESLKTLRQTYNEQLREDWRRAFKGVAGGLSLFEKEYHPLRDLDPELFLEWGLERTSDSTSLRRKLHHLFDTACSILGVHALMLGFDDADTDSTHAINLLECIRKYLDTPRVMVLVTGDMELYSLLVRQHFAATVAGKPEAALELQRSSKQGDRSAQYLRMIDHMEEQYLLKIFPIRQRMQLKPLWNIKSFDDYNVTFPTWGSEMLSIDNVVQAILRQGLRIKASSDTSIFADFLLKQPLRSVLQLLASCAPHLIQRPSGDLASDAWSRELTNTLSWSLQALALTSLYKFSIDTDAIAAEELPALTQAVFDLSLNDGDLDTAPYLRPTSAEQDIKACFAALAGQVPNFCAQKPGIALRYLLRGPGSVSIYNIASSSANDKDSTTHSDRVYRFKSYMGIGRREDSLDWARRATAVIASPYSANYKPRVVLPGIVGLRGGTKGRRGEIIARVAVQRAVNDESTTCLPVFALCTVNVVSTSNTRTYGSIFLLIGLIEKLLSADAQNETEARTVFEKAYPSLTISGPSWSRQRDVAAIDDADENLQQAEADTKEHDKQEALWKAIKDWLDDVRDLHAKTMPSSIFLGKVWTRLFFSLQNAAEDLKTRAKLDEILEIFSLCVINAFLVEEAEHHLLDSSTTPKSHHQVDRNNPRSSAPWFIDKLTSAKPNRTDFPFTSIMATCPLLLGLLNSDLAYARVLQPLFPANTEDQRISALLCPKAIKELMQKVSITGESRVQDKEKRGANETLKDGAAGTITK